MAKIEALLEVKVARWVWPALWFALGLAYVLPKRCLPVVQSIVDFAVDHGITTDVK